MHEGKSVCSKVNSPASLLSSLSYLPIAALVVIIRLTYFIHSPIYFYLHTRMHLHYQHLSCFLFIPPNLKSFLYVLNRQSVSNISQLRLTFSTIVKCSLQLNLTGEEEVRKNWAFVRLFQRIILQHIHFILCGGRGYFCY